MTRKAASLTTAIAATLALLGCGGQSLSAQAVSEARAITLRAGDLPGFESRERVSFHPFRTGPLLAQVERCDGGTPGPGGIAGVRGQFVFGRTGNVLISLHSAVYVLASESAAVHELTVLSSERARACIEGVARSRNALTRAFSVPLSPEQGARVFALRVVDARPGVGSRRRYVLDTDSRGFVLGRTLVVLYSEGLRAPVPIAIQRRALSLLYGRARADRL